MAGTCSIPLDRNIPHLFNLDELPIDDSEIATILSGPMSEVEALLIKQLRWQKYKFQNLIKPGFHYRIKKAQIFNMDLQEFQLIPHITDRIYHIKDQRGADYPERQRLEVRWSEYQKTVNFPRTFKADFPYLYYILRDQFMTNTINKRNVEKVMGTYNILRDVLSGLIARFWKFYELMQQVPGVLEWFKAHPERVPIVTDFEQQIKKLFNWHQYHHWNKRPQAH
jgi:hypothetical protein